MDVEATLRRALERSYRVERELGAGGMATVYLAYDVRHGREVAIKVLRPELGEMVGRERFLREIAVAARLQHPNILGLLDSGEAGGVLYYIMPHVAGESLRRRLDREGALSLAESLRLAREVADALAYAHRHGVTHRDIKPENILLQEGHALVADFGIAFTVREEREHRLTERGFSLGTPAYMSPEQIAGDQVDGRSDGYSLACVLYEMLTGAPPFRGQSAQEVLVAQLTTPPPEPCGMRESLPSLVAGALARNLDKDPAQRFRTTSEFAEALDGGAVVPSSPMLPSIRSIVVLPFEDASASAADAFFATGLTDEVISDLSKVRAVRVISRSSSMRFKEYPRDLKAIGRQLNVQFALTGSVRRSGELLRVTTELVDTHSDTMLWSEKYTSAITDVFDLQEAIARRIVEALAVTVTPEEAGQLASRTVHDLGVHETLVKARDASHSYDPDALDRAALLLHEAIVDVGESAALLAELASVQVARVIAGTADRPATLRAADRHATRAIERDPMNAKAHYAKAFATFVADGPHAAIPWARRALQLERSAETLLLGYYLAEAGLQLPEAVEMLREVVARDPLTPANHWYLGNVLLWSGHRDEAARAYRQSMVMGWPVADSYSGIGLAYASGGEEALPILRRLVPGERSHTWVELACRLEHALVGDPLPPASPRLATAAALEPMTASIMAGVAALAGERAEALQWMERAIRLGFTNVEWWTQLDPFLERFRTDDDFLSLVGRARAMCAAAAA